MLTPRLCHTCVSLRCYILVPVHRTTRISTTMRFPLTPTPVFLYIILCPAMNPSNGTISPLVPTTPGNHGRYRHIRLGACVLVHHVSSSLLRPHAHTAVAHSHDVLDSSLHTPDSHGLLTAYDYSPSHPMVAQAPIVTRVIV